MTLKNAVSVPYPSKRARRQEPSFRAFIPVAVLLSLVALVSSQQQYFLSAPSLQSLGLSLAPLLILALGQTFVILTGGIDLSIAALTSLGTVLLASWLPQLGPVAAVSMILLLTVLGAVTGLVSAKAQIPTFITTLGAMGLWSGLALMISGASTIQVTESYDGIGWIQDLRVAQIPMPVIISLGIVLTAVAAMKYLAKGNRLHAVGLAEQAVLMSGGSTLILRCVAFALSGLCAGIAALLLTASQYSGSPTLADSLLLPVIAAVVVGGTAITGGVGGPLRTIVGAAIIVTLRVGLTAMGIDPSFEQIFYGVMIIAAVALTLDRSRLKVVK